MSGKPTNRAGKRRQAKAQKELALAMMREQITRDNGQGGEAPFADLVDIIMDTINLHLRALDAEGADVLEHVVITMGRKPGYPTDVTIETKTAARKPDALAIVDKIAAAEDGPEPEATALASAEPPERKPVVSLVPEEDVHDEETASGEPMCKVIGTREVADLRQRCTLIDGHVGPHWGGGEYLL